jgi:integrase
LSRFYVAAGCGRRRARACGPLRPSPTPPLRGSITVHGFRSSFRDWAGETTDTPREIAEAALAHTIGNSAEQAYRRGDALEKRRVLMNAWGTFCDQPALIDKLEGDGDGR